MAIAATIAKPAESSILQGKKSVEPILRTENLWKLYRAGKVEVPALRGVNFEVLPGESVAVMGPSGCGKSSLLYLIGGLAQATRGKVLVDGNDLTALSDAARTKLRRHKIGFVFQRFNLLPTLTAKGNIAIAQFIHGDGFDPHRFEVVTQMLGLAGRLHHKPSDWFRDLPQGGGPAAPGQVRLLFKEGNRQTYRVDTRILAPPTKLALQNDLHTALQEALPELRNGNFSISKIEPLRDEQGAVTAYQVEIRH